MNKDFIALFYDYLDNAEEYLKAKGELSGSEYISSVEQIDESGMHVLIARCVMGDSYTDSATIPWKALEPVDPDGLGRTFL